MKFIRMLLVVVVGVLGLNIEGMQPQAPVQTVFDLPTDTPGLMSDKQVEKVCGEDKACVHVIVPKSEAEDAYNDPKLKPLNAKERVDCALSKKGNIYFPADGTQPTTEEAVEYSCANIDNTENSPITEWYMRICNTELLTTTNINSSTQRHRIEKILKKLSANPIGRLLLYRILIEKKMSQNGKKLEIDVSDIESYHFDRVILSQLLNYYHSILRIKFDLPEEITASPVIIGKDFYKQITLDNFWNISFPMSGHQPTTEEAAEYSCANIDNTKNSPITEWYMKMFGVIDKNGGNSDNDDDYVKIDGKQIVTFGSSVKVKTKNSFKKMFNEMATDPVGRMLLYRLLIEICRYNSKSMKGCTEKAWQMLGKENKRNALRHILVEYVEYVWQFNWGNSTLSFNDQDYSTYAVKIYNNNDTWVTRYGKTPMVVYLFHEMLHWFHNIQCYGRYSDDKIKDSLGQHLLKFGNFIRNPQIWNGQAFGIFTANLEKIAGEEVATILGKGIKIDGDANYENGDELSENLFSCSLTERSQGKIRATMRWGHALLPINGDQSTKKVMQCAYDNVIRIMSKITGREVEFWKMKNGGAFLAENETVDVQVVTGMIRGMYDTIAKTESSKSDMYDKIKNGILEYLKKIYADVQ